MNYDWNFSRLLPYWQAFLAGTFTTVSLTLVVLLCGTTLGLALGLALRRRAASKILYPIIDVLRALPPLVLLLALYYALSQQIIGTTFSAYCVAAIAFTLNLAAFTADLVRAAVDGVPAGALDAGRALSMRREHLTKYIVLPHVARELLPPMLALYIGVLKMTSLASVINVREVVYATQTVIADISRSLEAWTLVGVIYIGLVIPSTMCARRLERWAKRGRSPNTYG